MLSQANPDIVRWNERYKPREDSDLPLALGETELVENKHHLGCSGVAAELACGKGNNALYLASVGYHVVACDGALNALQQCRKSARKMSIPICAVVCDLENHQWPKHCFELISVVRYLYRPLFKIIKESVKPGGLIFYKTFNTNHLLQQPNFNSDFVLRLGELEEEFGGFEILSSNDHVRSTAPTSFILARCRKDQRP